MSAPATAAPPEVAADARSEYARIDDAMSGMVDHLGTLRSARAAIDAVEIRSVDILRRMWEQQSGASIAHIDDLAWRSLRAEVAQVTRSSEAEAGVLLFASRDLVTVLPATMSALENGNITRSHAIAIARPVTALPTELLGEYESRVLAVAETAAATGRFARTARQIAEQLHPAGLEQRSRAAFDDRGAILEPASDGMAYIGAYAPAVAAVGAYAAVDALARGLRAQGDPRTLDQLRADVMVDLLTDAGGVLPPVTPGGDARPTPAAQRGVRAEVVVHVPADILASAPDVVAEADASAGWLDGFGPVGPATALRTAGLGSTLRRVLTDPVTGRVLEADASRYRIPEHLRFAAEMRDGTCRSPGCTRPATSCELDHLVPWQEHVPTTLENLQALCKGHHLLKHGGGWAPSGDPNGTLTWTGPSGRTYTSTPAPPRIRPRPAAAARPGSDPVRFRDPWRSPTGDPADDTPFT